MNVRFGSDVILTCASDFDNVDLYWVVVTIPLNLNQSSNKINTGTKITAKLTATRDLTVIRCSAEQKEGAKTVAHIHVGFSYSNHYYQYSRYI